METDATGGDAEREHAQAHAPEREQGWRMVQGAFTFLSAVFDAAAPVMERYGLHQKSLVLLALLDLADTPQALARLLHAPPSTLSHLLRSLEGGGLIARALDESDRRRFRLRRTPDGDAALAAGIAAINESVAARLATLTDAERAAVAAAPPLLLRLGGRGGEG